MEEKAELQKLRGAVEFGETSITQPVEIGLGTEGLVRPKVEARRKAAMNEMHKMP